MTTTPKPCTMPEEIYASPRGSGTVSGVWTDYDLDDEEIIVRYVRADLVEKMKDEDQTITKEQLIYGGINKK